jgi:hypothetical protein
LDDLISSGLLKRPASSSTPPPWWLIRGGRGRCGGSTFLDFVAQWARRRGRPVVPLDGDLRSRTLIELHPPGDAGGRPLPTGARRPESDDPEVIKPWISNELDGTVEDRACRVVDFGGGDRVLQDYGQDLKLGAFCQQFDIGLVCAFLLGPDPEDLRHATQVIGTGAVDGAKILLVLNEGVIRTSLSTEGVFDRTQKDAAFIQLLEQGAEQIVMGRLICLPQLRERRLGFYQAAAGGLDFEGKRTRPTTQHMVKMWLKDLEERIAGSEVAGWLA